MAVVLITGTSSGFGMLAALAFARRGHRVFASMRDTGKAGPLQHAAAADCLKVDVVQLDVTDSASVDAAVERVLREAGRIDVLVNNAGIGAVAAVEDFADEEFTRVFDTNVFGIIRVSRAVLPHMRKQGSGRIVNIGSLAGIVSSPFRGVYSASKAAVEALTDAMYYEAHPFGVHVCVVEPGFFETSISANRMPMRRDPAASAYTDLQKRFDEAAPSATGGGQRPDPAPVADVILQAATEDPPRRRYLAGKDAEALAPLHKKLSDEEFEKVMRQALNFWE
jgi:NAD(P)-dependent dehydrogenase (short-subunit alcohol dehydrogenase family)